MRKELLVTQDINRYNQVKARLQENEIPFTTKSVDRTNPIFGFGSRSRTQRGTLGQNISYQYYFYIYVKSKDLAMAKQIL